MKVKKKKPITSRETKLIKKLAAAYSFISSLRTMGIASLNVDLIHRTTGIQQSIDVMRKEYPVIFMRYYNDYCKLHSKVNQKVNQKESDEKKET